MNDFLRITDKLPPSIRDELSHLPNSIISKIEEIRLRCGQNVKLQSSDFEKMINHIVTPEDLQHTLNNLIKYSYYAYEEDLAKGFITIEGGHRVGVCGKAVIKNGQPTLIKEISSLNIRFGKEIRGCANKIENILTDKFKKPLNTLIVSPPNCGKTTMLRDITRILSHQKIKVSVCDERSEIAGMYNSTPSFDLGSRTDVLDCLDKAIGIPMLIRSMSPDVIVTDEIGKTEDVNACLECMNSGVSLVTSIHGNSREDLLNSNIAPLIEKNFFQNIVYLSNKGGAGTITKVESV